MSSKCDDSQVEFSSSEMRAKRAKQAFVNCKLHKVKCDGSVTEPCTQCQKKRIECVHSPPLKRGRKLKTEVPVGENVSSKPNLAPRSWYNNYDSIFPTNTMSSYQARIQSFLDISQFYPFFTLRLDGKIAAEVWNTLYSRSLQSNLVNAADQALLLSYLEHALAFGYGCHLMNYTEDSMHFYRLEEELFTTFQSTNWKVGPHLVSRLVETLLMKIDFESITQNI
jgi:hypothetical protein